MYGDCRLNAIMSDKEIAHWIACAALAGALEWAWALMEVLEESDL